MDRLELARFLGAEAGAVAEAEASRATVIAEREPTRFMSAFAQAVAAGGEVFLADPEWTPAQLAELHALTLQSPARANDHRGGWLMIPSGGSSGRLKFARHDEAGIAAAVGGFCAHFGFTRVNAVGVLPLHHVSGLMAWLRCALTGGTYAAWDWQRLEALEVPPRPPERDWVISLVPTQLQRLLAVPEMAEWLRGFRAIFLGGGPAWPALHELAARENLPISLSYGMTETLAMLTALWPEEFRDGERSSGPALPHAHVRIGADDSVVVSAESLFRGYYPDWRDTGEFVTEDLGRMDPRGHLQILGRRDAVIITGGKKVHPAEVEAALRASGEFTDIAVIGVPDAEWGEAVVAFYPASAKAPNVVRAASLLAGFQRPKRFVALADLPRNAQGKVNRAALLAQIIEKQPS